jgi:hypothetical protein
MHNWIHAGINDWCRVKADPRQFSLEVITKASKTIADFDSASAEAAHAVANAWSGKPLFLGISGGMDSEYTATTFLRERIPFTPYILNITGVNDTEAWFAHYFCYKNKLTPLVKTISAEEYQHQILKKYLPELSNTNNVNLSLFLYSADYIKSIGGYILNSAGDINYDFEEKKFFCGLVDFCLDVYRTGEHPSSFFVSTPEFALSYISQFDESIDEQYNKINFYGISPRPKMDYLSNLYSDMKIKSILNTRAKYVPITTPHWYGSKADVISTLY